MPQETERLKLPLPLGNENVTRESINGIFEKIDAGVATQADLDALREAVSQMGIPDASLTQKGKVQLGSSTTSNSESHAATSKAVNDARQAAIAASVPRTGGSMTGRLTMNAWGTFSGSTNGSTLYGSNCYLDGNTFKYENTHSNLGARGIYMRYSGGGSQPEVYMFDTGPISTTAGATFTPTLNRIVNAGESFQRHKVTNDNGVVLNISNQNINNLVVTGFYAGENIENAPTTAVGAWWYIEVIAMSGTHIKQIAMDLFNNTYQQRTNNGSGWSAWSPDVFQSGVDAKQGIVNAINAKGGSASTNDTWAQLATKINSIQQGNYQAGVPGSSGGFTVPGAANNHIVATLATFSAGTKLISLVPKNTNGWLSYIALADPSRSYGAQFALRDNGGRTWIVGEAVHSTSVLRKSLLYCTIDLVAKTQVAQLTLENNLYANSSRSWTYVAPTPPVNFNAAGQLTLVLLCYSNEASSVSQNNYLFGHSVISI
ncbi:pyocin knob domain-containing protein [Paenibacillus sp. FSL H8-0079]|uniref:pyocin knob domain-containing protein n=1 Tax=Paenibacillus sp. FSL H8-0079 TaxID=2921375 RepID=UPI0030EF103B